MPPKHRLKLTGAAILVFRGFNVFAGGRGSSALAFGGNIEGDAMNDTSDQDPTSSIAGREFFKAGFWNALAGVISALALVAAGATLVVYEAWEVYANGGKPPPHPKGDGSPDWPSFVMMTAIGLGLIVGGVAVMWYARRLFSHGVEVHPGGLRYCAGAITDEVRWSEVAMIREVVLYARALELHGPAKLMLPKVARTEYTVMTRGGKEYEFDENSVKGIKRFGAVLREQAARCGVPWETIEQHA